MDQKNDIPSKETRITQIVDAALKDIAKIEADIIKRERNGSLVLQFNLNPPDMPNDDKALLERDVSKLQGTIQWLKTNAVKETGRIIDTFPQREQEFMKEKVQVLLQPAQAMKVDSKVEEKFIVTKFSQSLNFVQDNKEDFDRARDRSMERDF